MKIVIGNYAIDINEDEIRKSRRSSWVSGRVKAFEWTRIDRNILTEKFTEVYNLVRGTTEDEK